MKKKLLIITGVIALVLAIFFIVLTNGLSEGTMVNINGVNLAGIPDGSYTGVYEFKRWSNMVVVHVNNNEITSIDIEQDVFAARVTNASGEMIRRVIESQNTTVDTVSGATVTSKAYLMAIEDALR